MADFGKYKLLERLASGGMAELFLAAQTGVGGFSKTVVIKRIHKHLSADYEFTTMFINEARVSAQLSHQNIVQVYDFGEHDGSYYIAMEYVFGQDLKSVYKSCRKKRIHLPLPLAIYVIQQICKGLDYAHRKKDSKGKPLDIVHRDVSPQNILISYEGEVKIADFGIAKAAGASRLTQAGTLKGKIAYMSPEQAWGRPVDRRSDVFSIGIVFWEILTNTRLFFGNSDFDTLEKVRNCDIPDILQIVPSLSKEVDRILRKSLSKEAENRYQSAAEMHHDLEVFSAAHGFYNQSPELANFLQQHFLQDKDSEEGTRPKSLTVDGSAAEESQPIEVISRNEPPKSAAPTVQVPALPSVAQQVVAQAREAVRQPPTPVAAPTSKAPVVEEDPGHGAAPDEFRTVMSKQPFQPVAPPPAKPPTPPPSKPPTPSLVEASQTKKRIEVPSAAAVAPTALMPAVRPESVKKAPVKVQPLQQDESQEDAKRPTRPLSVPQPESLDVADPRRPTRAVAVPSTSAKKAPEPVQAKPLEPVKVSEPLSKPSKLSPTKAIETPALDEEDALIEDLDDSPDPDEVEEDSDAEPAEDDAPKRSPFMAVVAILLVLASVGLGVVLIYILREKGLLLPPNLLPSGSVKVQTLPGAEVFVGGKSKGQTDASGVLTIADLLSDTQEIKVVKDGYADLTRKIKVRPRKTAPVDAYPDRLQGRLVLSINEPGVRMYLNGFYFGRSVTEKDASGLFRTVMETAPAGDVSVIAAKQDRKDAEQKVTLPPQGSVVANLELTAQATEWIDVQVESNQVQAFAILDGELKGVIDDISRPISLKLEQGAHELVVVKGGFDPVVFRRTQWVTGKLRADLKPAVETGALKITTTVEGYSLLVDGREILRGIKGEALIPGIDLGKHWVQILHPTFKAAPKEVKVLPGQVASVNMPSPS